MPEKLSPSSEKESSPLQHIVLFAGGTVYGILGAGEPDVSSIGAGVAFSGAIEYAARPEKKGIGLAAGGGVVTGIVLRQLLHLR